MHSTLRDTHYTQTVVRNLKYLFEILILVLFVSCVEDSKRTGNPKALERPDSISTQSKDIKTKGGNKKNNLKVDLNNLATNCLDFDNLYSVFDGVDYSDHFLESKNEPWLFNLHQKDSLQFDHADLIVPKCKVFENDHILSIVFVDIYDYKNALHLFTFKKPNLKPTSSFIFYQIGGDGEDFWNIYTEKVSDLKYSITEESGYDNSSIKENEYLIEYREIREYEVDSINGKIQKRLFSTKKNFKEIRN